MEDNRKKEKQLQDKLNNFLKNNDNTCDGEE